MRRLLCVSLALLAAGCGDGGERRAQPAGSAPAEPAPAPAAPGLPPHVPSEATGPAPPGAERVVRRWAAAIRRADFRAAADLFAIPALVQNGGAVERLDTAPRVLAWNASLPCGAVVMRVRGARGHAIADFRLTDRVGSRCDAAEGASARSALLVQRGLIKGWYRLPDPGGGQEEGRPGPVV